MSLWASAGNTNFWSYKNADEKGLINQMNESYLKASAVNLARQREAQLDTQCDAGDSSIYHDFFSTYPSSRNKMISLNHCRRARTMISGHQRRMRKSTVATPSENADQKTTEQLSETIFWAMKNDGTLNKISGAFDQTLITGMSLIYCDMDFRRDPVSGDIRTKVLSYNDFFIDPFFKEHDLSDCRFIWTREWMNREQLLSIFPDRKEDIESLNGLVNRDGRFQFQPENFNFGYTHLFYFDRYYYKTTRKQDLLVDLESGETMEWRGQDEDLNRYLKAFPRIEKKEQLIDSVNLGIVVHGRPFYHGPLPSGMDRYPFTAVLGFYNPHLPYPEYTSQGITRGLRTPQWIYNRRKSIELDIAESTLTSGYKYRESSLVNPEDIFLTGQGKGLAMSDEANMDDVQRIDPPQIPPSFFQLSEGMAKEMLDISGVSEELLGVSEDDKSGVLNMLRQGAGLTTLQILFDQLDFSQKMLGEIFADLIQLNFSKGKVRRIVGDLPDPMFFQKGFLKYDIEIINGVNTDSQRHMQFIQAMALKQTGIPVPDKTLIDLSDMQNKTKLLGDMAEEAKAAQQMSEMQHKTELAEKEAVIESLRAQAMANVGLGRERESRIEENKALQLERISKAVREEEEAVLNKAKVLKELEDIDIGHLRKLIDTYQALKNAELMETAGKVQKSESPNMRESVQTNPQEGEENG